MIISPPVKSSIKFIFRNKKAPGAIPKALEMLFIGNKNCLQTLSGSSYLFSEYSVRMLK